MRILAVGNMYPPHSLGGYELVWWSAVAHLRDSGHEVRVLTSDYRVPGLAGVAPPDVDVHRELRWYWRDHRFPRMGPAARLRLERHNAGVFDRHVAEFGPDAVSWWAMGGMSLSLIERGRRAGLPATGFVHDDWMAYGPAVDGWTRLSSRLPDTLAGPLGRGTGIATRLDLSAAGEWWFVSDHTRRRAVEAAGELAASGVAHSGIDADLFGPAPPQPWQWRLLYVGRVDARKGIDTAIDSLTALPAEATLTIVGAGSAGDMRELRALAELHGLGRRVVFARSRRRAELPRVYAGADATIFPGRWEEPWGLVPLESMAVGTPVVATGTGGSAEYLRDGGNCLLFPPGDGIELATAIKRLAADEGLRTRLREGGLTTAPNYTEQRFNESVAAAVERAHPREPR